MSNSVQPHRRQPTRLPHPWDSPGKNTGVGCQQERLLLYKSDLKGSKSVSVIYNADNIFSSRNVTIWVNKYSSSKKKLFTDHQEDQLTATLKQTLLWKSQNPAVRPKHPLNHRDQEWWPQKDNRSNKTLTGWLLPQVSTTPRRESSLPLMVSLVQKESPVPPDCGKLPRRPTQGSLGESAESDPENI